MSQARNQPVTKVIKKSQVNKVSSKQKMQQKEKLPLMEDKDLPSVKLV